MNLFPSFTLGIEEEYLIVHADTLDLVVSMPREFIEDCKQKLGQQVTKEYLQCQVEIGTKVCDTVQEARDEIIYFRQELLALAKSYGCYIIAASTHPFAAGQMEHTREERYDNFLEQLQAVVRRLVICGMHIHVGIEDDDIRIDLMGQAAYTLPHLLAMSTSSPFWKGENTGLKSYRVSVFDEMPRTGLPEKFASFSEYERTIDVLIKNGIIKDPSAIWWDIRPSCKFPTLEARLADICTDLNDGIAIAAAFRCWLRMLYRLKKRNQRWRSYPNFLIAENRWRAHRYGIDEGMFDFGEGEVVSFDALIEEFIELTAPDAEFFDCQEEMDHLRTILKRGTSAHHQLQVFENAQKAGKSKEEALKDVVQFLVDKTQQSAV